MLPDSLHHAVTRAKTAVQQGTRLSLHALRRRPVAWGIGLLIVILSVNAFIEILGEWTGVSTSHARRAMFIAGIRTPSDFDWFGRPTLRMIVKEASAGQFSATFELTMPPHAMESTGQISLLIDGYPLKSGKFLEHRAFVLWRTHGLFRYEQYSDVVWKSQEPFLLPLTGSGSWFMYPFETHFGIWKLFFFDSEGGRWRRLDMRPIVTIDLPPTYRVRKVNSIDDVPERHRTAMFSFLKPDASLQWEPDLIFGLERGGSVRAGVIALMSIFLVPLYLLWQGSGSFDFLNAAVSVIAVRSIVLGQSSSIYALDLVLGIVLVVAAVILLLRPRKGESVT